MEHAAMTAVSCYYGYPWTWCCFVSPRLVIEKRGNVTQSTRRGEKVLCELLPGNFNWALKCFFSFDNIFFSFFFLPEAALIGVPFCLRLWFHRSNEDLYKWIFIGKDLNVRPATRTDACVFSASLLLLKWKWPCCGAYGSANGAQPQLFSRRRRWKYTIGPREDVPSYVWSFRTQHDLPCLSLRISLILFFCLPPLFWNSAFGN